MIGLMMLCMYVLYWMLQKIDFSPFHTYPYRTFVYDLSKHDNACTLHIDLRKHEIIYFSIQTKVHSFLKQCSVCTIFIFMKTRSFQQEIFVDMFFDCCCEMYFGAPSRYGKGWVISVKNIAEQFGPSFWYSKKQNANLKIWESVQMTWSTHKPNKH